MGNKSLALINLGCLEHSILPSHSEREKPCRIAYWFPRIPRMLGDSSVSYDDPSHELRAFADRWPGVGSGKY